MVIKKIEEDQIEVADADKLKIKEHEACKIMRGLGMRFVKVHHIALSANSERSLVLRQQWAIKLLQQDLMNKTLYSLDETWLG